MNALTLSIEFIRTDGVAQGLIMNPGDNFVIGRDLGCDCRLEGRKVSRRHVVLRYLLDGRIVVEDKGSHNGTFVDGVRVLESQVSRGATLTVGEWEGKIELGSDRPPSTTIPQYSALEFSSDATGVTAGISREVQTQPMKPSPEDASDAELTSNSSETAEVNIDPRATRVINMNTVWQWQDEKAEVPNAPKDKVRSTRVAENPIVRAIAKGSSEIDFKGLKDLENLVGVQPLHDGTRVPGVELNTDAVALRMMFNVMESLYRATSLTEFLDEMSHSLLDAARAKAVAVLLPKAGELIPVVLKNRHSEEALQISKTVLDHAVSTRSAVTTEDAAADERFASGASVLRFDLKAVLVVPLIREERLIGALYMTRDLPFTDAELQLVAALGHVIGIGLERSLLREEIEKEAQRRRTLERFHAPDVVRRLMMHGDGPAPAKKSGLFLENLTATILFCDLSGFTTFCEGNSPEVVGRLLNSYLAEMTDVVFEHGGTVDKYIGDAIMCIFGAPFSAPDDPVRAVRCAVAMRERFNEMVSDGSFDGIGDDMSVHIGVNTGPVVAGTVGSDRRMEYTALGDTVNIAARFEGIAGPGEIVIGAETQNKTADFFKMKAMGSVPIKGKRREVDAWSVESAL